MMTAPAHELRLGDPRAAGAGFPPHGRMHRGRAVRHRGARGGVVSEPSRAGTRRWLRVARARWVCALLVLVLWPTGMRALDPQKSLDQFNVHSWGRQAGLPGDGVRAVTQDRDGFIWLAVQNQLVRYDGRRYAVESAGAPAAEGQVVRGVAPRAGGGLWVALSPGGLVGLEGNGGAVPVSAALQGPTVGATAVLAARNGDVWVGTDAGVTRLPASASTHPVVYGEVGPVLSLCEDSLGRIWIGTAKRGLFVWRYGQVAPVGDPSLARLRLQALAADGHRIWIGTDAGLRCCDAAGRPVPTEPVAANIRALLVDHAGMLWIGTDGDGVARRGAGGITFLRKAGGLAGNQVDALAEDREGSLWVGTRSGLTQISDVKFPIFSEAEGLIGGSVHSVAPSIHGGLWIATAQGFSYFDGRHAVNYGQEFLPRNNYVKIAFEASNGDVYFVDGDRRIGIVAQGKIVSEIQAPDWPEAFAEDADGVVVGIGSGLFRIRDGRLIPCRYRGDREPQYDWIENLASAPRGAILVASARGVFRLQDGRWRQWSTANGLSSDRVYVVREDPDGTLWAAMPTGLARIRHGEVRNITQDNGLPDAKIYAIVPDGFGYFWLQCSRGIVRVSRAALNECADGRSPTLRAELFNGQNDVKTTERSDQGYGGCSTLDGRIWFPSPRGVIMVDPARYWRNTVPPLIHLSRLQSAGSADQAESANRTIGFSFAALTYIAPNRVRVQYRLQGLDSTWIAADGSPSVRYSDLRPGAYRFEVRAGNADGFWNSRALAFRVVPPFYRTSWFYAVCVLAAATLAGGAYRWRIRHMALQQERLQRDKEVLETRVAERTRELAREQALLRALLDHSPDKIYFKDTQSRYLAASHAQAEDLGAAAAGALVGRTDQEFLDSEHARAALAQEAEIMRTGRPVVSRIERQVRKDGRETWLLTSRMPLRNASGEIVGTFGVSKDITAIKEAEAKLEDAHRQLVEASRHAGMAEVATNVLHNVGNVLNSANVSASLVAEQLRRLKVGAVSTVAGLLTEHAPDLATYLSADPKGSKVTRYLAALGTDLEHARDAMIGELEHLRQNIDHIREIVSTQQRLAKACGVREQVALTDLVEDALRLQGPELRQHRIRVTRDFRADPRLILERHKVLQILVNLVQNAVHACRDAAREDPQVTVRVEQDGLARITVSDNGVGIPAENLTRIFAHGFSTKPGGHGFGLHGSALAARELGGELRAQSEGPGLGAVFTLELPPGGGAEES